jgi:intracellular multiplication protein IcmV
MKFRKVIHRLFWGITPRKWLSFDQLKSNSAILKDLAASIMPGTSSEAHHAKTFADAVRLAGISESDLARVKAHNLRAFRIFLVLGVLTFFYACYLCVDLPVEAFMVLMLSLLMFVYAWREHYNLIKIQFRKLYLSPKEWLKLSMK